MHQVSAPARAESPDPASPGRRGLVLIVFHEEAVGGATRSVLRAVPHLQADGWSFAFWVSKPSALFDHLKAAGYDVDGEPRHVGFSWTWMRQPPGPRHKLVSMPRWFRGLARRIGELQPVLVHANSAYTIPDAALARLTGRPVLLHSHEMLPTRKADLLPPLLRLARIEPIGASTACAMRLSWRGREPAVVYESSPVPELVDEGPTAGTGPFVVGTVGYISRRKGSDVFVAAAERLLSQRRDIHFQMIGQNAPSSDYEWGEEVLARAAAAGIEHRESADVFQALRAWDLLVAPSRHDPFPLVVLEAMASRVPVVGSDVDGLTEQLTAETGRLVPSEDPAALAEQIAELLADPGLRARMGVAARKRVIENFTPVHQAARLSAIYESMAEPRGGCSRKARDRSARRS